MKVVLLKYWRFVNLNDTTCERKMQYIIIQNVLILYSDKVKNKNIKK